MLTFIKSLFDRPDYKDQIPNTVYNSLDWSRTLIGGSYALKQYTGDHWKPNDIDIFIACKNLEDFQISAKDFINKNDAKFIRNEQNYNKNVSPIINKDIVGVIDLNIKNIDTKIQLIGINTNNVGNTLFNKLQQYDNPTCVTYTVSSLGNKIFHISAECMQIIKTRKVPFDEHQLVERKRKYEARGFTFE